MWKPNILIDIHEPLLNKINAPEEERTAESLYRRKRNTEDNRETETVVENKMRKVLTPTTMAQIKNIAKFILIQIKINFKFKKNYTRKRKQKFSKILTKELVCFEPVTASIPLLYTTTAER